MAAANQPNPYSLRIDEQLKEKARNQAHAHRRSLNVEFGLLIEEGLKWREAQKLQAVA
jgi:hypothetical protein